MTAPAVIRAGAAGLQSASKIRKRKRRTLIRYLQLYGRSIECVQGLTYLLQQIPLLIRLSAVSIKPTETTKENLATHAELGIQTDQARNLFQLGANWCLWKRFVKGDGRRGTF